MSPVYRSHCVNFTVVDILKHWPTQNSQLHLLLDGCSSVGGFESVGQRFLDDMIKKGVTVLKCKDVIL